MTQPAGEIIDLIVREVLARLAGVGGDPLHRVSPPPTRVGGRESAASPGPHESDRHERQDGELAVSARVVSLAAVEDRMEGVRRLVVPPGAVVTPSVRDELRRRNIALVRDRSATSTGGGARVLIMVLGSRFDPAPLKSALAGEGLEVRIDRADCLVAATDAVARELDRPDCVALVASVYPAVAVCLANRHAGVRAVLGIDPGRLAGDAASAGANVLVLDPRSSGPFQLRQMALQFCRGAPFACPEELRERLG